MEQSTRREQLTRWPDETIQVGRINGLFGVQGWVKVYSWMRPPQQILDFRHWWLEPESAHKEHDRSGYSLVSGRCHGKGLVVQLQGCHDRDAAAALLNRQIHIDKAEFPKLEEGHYYWHQLIGLSVQNQDQVNLGTVDELLETGANDVLVVSGERQRLLPYIPAVVLDVDLEKRLIQVDWDPEY